MKKIALCGTPEFVCHFFDAVYKSAEYKIEFVLTQCAKKRDRGYSVCKSPVAIWAAKHGIECFEIDSIKYPTTYEKTALETKLKQLDCVLLFAFGKIIPQTWLSLPAMGWLNIHPSKLPLLRGSSPIQYSILNQMNVSALTLMVMDAGMDTGDIIAQLDFTINEHHTTNSLIAELCSFGPAWVVKMMTEYLNSAIKSQAQQGLATYSKLVNKDDYMIRHDDTTESVSAKIKAFGYVYLPNSEIKCFACKRATEGSEFVVELSNGVIEPVYIQKPGKKIMHIRHFLNGMRK